LKNQKINYPFLVLSALWLVVHIFLLFKNGIITEGESPKYIEQAQLFLSTGHFSSGNFWLYAVQIFLLMVTIKLNLGYVFLVMVQLIFSLVALWCFYRLATTLFSGLTGLVCCALFLLNYPFHEFNTFLQTESLFYSLTVIFSAYLLQTKTLTTRRGFIIFLWLVLICFTRPTGILFVPPAMLFLFFRFFRTISFSRKILITTFVSVVFLFFLNTAIGSGGELDFMLPFRDERIICGVPTLPYFRDLKTTENSNSLYGLMYYIYHNFGQFTRLAFLKSVAFWGLMRGYYSTGHNIYLAVFFYPLFTAVVLGMRYWFTKASYILTYCLFIILLTWCTVILTCDDWHNRFFLTISPYLIILAAPSINKLFSKFVSDGNERPA